MARTIRYPKKFRQKLEKIAAARDAREAQEAGATPDVELDPLDDPTKTLWHEFLSPGSVEFMHAEIDEQRRRISTMHYMQLRRSARRLRKLPPWAETLPVV